MRIREINYDTTAFVDPDELRARQTLITRRATALRRLRQDG